MFGSSDEYMHRVMGESCIREAAFGLACQMCKRHHYTVRSHLMESFNLFSSTLKSCGLNFDFEKFKVQRLQVFSQVS